jgi:hypothetical protein
MVLLNTFFDALTSDYAGNRTQRSALLYQHIMQNVDSELEILGLSLPSGVSIDNCAANYLETFVSHPSLCQVANLNAEQQHVHDCVLQDMSLPVGHVFVLTASAGTGKTYLINAILASARTKGLRAVPCASSGLAASLLGYARTGHGLFKIPTLLEEFSHCRPRACYKCVPVSALRGLDLFRVCLCAVRVTVFVSLCAHSHNCCVSTHQVMAENNQFIYLGRSIYGS